MNTALVSKAFKVTGIAPLDPDVILNRFRSTTERSRPSSSGSSSSVLSASDWRKIEQLLQRAVENLHDWKSKKLNRTLHTISVKNTMLQHENRQLREALANEKKRRQRGKALLLEAPPQYDGGAVFWSPQKVSEARLRQQQKDLEEEQIQHQKSEAIQLREQQKLAKAQLLEERCQNRVAAKEQRELKAVEKAAAREDARMARQLQTQLQNDLKTIQKGQEAERHEK